MIKHLLIIPCLLIFYKSIGQIEITKNTISFDEIEFGQCYQLCPENKDSKFIINKAIFDWQIDTLVKGVTPNQHQVISYRTIVIKKWRDNFCHTEEKRNAICFVELKDTSEINIIGTFNAQLITQRKTLLKNASIKFLSIENKTRTLNKILSEYYSRGVTIVDIKKKLIALGYPIELDGNLDDLTKEIIEKINLEIGAEPHIISKEFLKYLGLMENELDCICQDKN